MTERAVRAEQRSQEGSEADGAARRTLVLAQRTADATVAEAKETAARLIAQAQEEARTIILAGETAAETLPSAEPTARAEIADLEVTRSRLQADVAALESHVTDRRARIKGLLDELQRRVDDGLDSRIARWPSVDDEDALQYEEATQYEDDTDIVLLGQPDLNEPIDTSSVETDTASEEVDLEPDDEEPDAVEVVSIPPEWEQHDVSGTESQPVSGDELTEPAPVPAYTELSAREVDDDTYFAQLRGALDDDAPLGPREESHGMPRWREEAATAVAEAPSLYDQGEPERRKFGRKKRRQP
jgi:vacuolar-type H+-ATPase subunit H